jgi:hypothetical protein
MRSTLLAASAAILLCPAALAAPASDCKSKAISDLARLSPRGHAVYAAASDKKFFTRWIGCDDVQLGLATAVHETVHLLTEEKDAFVLIDGDSIRRVHSVSRFFPPREIAGRFDGSSPYVQTYLRPGGASSVTDFLYLLDELNAYSHDLNSVILLQSLRKTTTEVDHRDGLAALMSFVMAYADTAKRQKPSTWEGLQKAETKHVLQVLWGQAEKVLTSSCGVPGIGHGDRKSIAFMCDPANNGAMSDLLGRAAVCASACLGGGPSAQQSGQTIR